MGKRYAISTLDFGLGLSGYAFCKILILPWSVYRIAEILMKLNRIIGE